MVRTKSDAGASKVSVAKAPRKVLGSSSSGSGSASSNSPCRSSGSGISKDRYSGGNAYNSQPTPNWQKGIGTFFKPDVQGVKDKENCKTPEKVEEMCTEASSSKHSNENNESGKTAPSLPSPKKSREESTEISVESSFNKNGVISDDDD